jgi:hypothetical protein
VKSSSHPGRPGVAPSNLASHADRRRPCEAELQGRIDARHAGNPVGLETTIIPASSSPSAAAAHCAQQHRARASPIRVAIVPETPASLRGETPLAPGMLISHYGRRAPPSSVSTSDDLRRPPEALLAFGNPFATPAGRAARTLNLSAAAT